MKSSAQVPPCSAADRSDNVSDDEIVVLRCTSEVLISGQYFRLTRADGATPFQSSLAGAVGAVSNRELFTQQAKPRCARVSWLLTWDEKRATSYNQAYLTALLACWQDTAAYGPGLQTNVSTV